MQRVEKFKFSGLHINIKIRLVTIFLNTFSTNMIFPFIAIYSYREIGPIWSSTLLSLAIIFNFIASLISGSISDKIGRRKLILISEGLRFFSLIGILLVNSPWIESVYITLFLFIINNIASGIFGPPSEAMILDVSESEERKYIYSLLYWISNISIAIGGSIGAVFFSKYLFELLMIINLLMIVSLILTVFYMKETYFPIKTKKVDINNYISGITSFFSGYKAVLKNRRFILFLCSTTLLFSLEGHLTNYLSLKLVEDVNNQTIFPFNMQINGVQMLGILRTENTILVMVFSTFLVILIGKFRDKNLLIIGSALYAIGYFVLSVTDFVWLLLIAMLIATLGEVIAFPVMQSYLADIIPHDSRSTYLAFNKISIRLSLLVGTIGIFLYSFLPYYIMSLLLLFSGILAISILFLILPNVNSKRVKNS